MWPRRARARHLVLLGATLLLVAAPALAREAGEWTPTARQVAQAEAAARLPVGARPLTTYARYYTGVTMSGRRVIVGRLVDAGIVGRPAGVRLVPSQAQLPDVQDGGCSVVTIYFDLAAARQAGAHCNGLA